MNWTKAIAMPDATRIHSVTLTNFRGIRGTHRFDLNADFVLLQGPNGTGKTSVFDAVLWLLTGSIPRLATHRLRKNDNYVVNSYARSSVAEVKAHFRTPRGDVTVTREGDTSSSHLRIEFDGLNSLADGTAVGDSLGLGSAPIEEILKTSGLLQQDDLRLLLRDKPNERYRQLLRLLGLEVLERFEKFASREESDARLHEGGVLENLNRLRQQFARVESELGSVRTLVSSSSSESLVGLSIGGLEASRVRLTRPINDPQDIIGVASELDGLRDNLSKLRSRLSELCEVADNLSNETPELSPADLERANAARTAAKRQLEEASAALDESESARRAILAGLEDRVAARRAALPLMQHDLEVSPDGHHRCPVCDSEIDLRSVIGEIESMTAESPELEEIGRLVESRRAAVETARRLLQRVDAAADALWARDKRHRDLVRDLRYWRSELRQALTHTDLVQLPELVKAESALAEPEEVKWAYSTYSELDRVFELHIDQLIRSASAVRTARARVRASLEVERQAQALERLSVQLTDLNASIRAAESDHELARESHERAKQIAVASRAATERVLRTRFDLLAPLMNDVYSRLDPHPTFKQLDFRVEPYRSRGTAMPLVRDLAEDVEQNPLLVFSSAQANIVVLSAFLAIGWAMESALGFVLLDDPLQSLDDVNVLGLSDVFVELGRRKQIVCSTHEPRFARLLERKQSRAGQSILVHEFKGWDREGTEIEVRSVRPMASEGAA